MKSMKSSRINCCHDLTKDNGYCNTIRLIVAYLKYLLFSLSCLLHSGTEGPLSSKANFPHYIPLTVLEQRSSPDDLLVDGCRQVFVRSPTRGCYCLVYNVHITANFISVTLIDHIEHIVKC